MHRDTNVGQPVCGVGALRHAALALTHCTLSVLACQHTEPSKTRHYAVGPGAQLWPVLFGKVTMSWSDNCLRWPPRAQAQQGVAAVEFALVLPVLLALVLGVVDLGLAVYTQSVLSHASREGARAGVVLALTRPSSQTIAAVVQTDLSNSLGSVDKFGTLAFTPPSPCVDANGQLTVQMSYSFKGFAMGAVAAAFSQPLVLTAKTTMACE